VGLLLWESSWNGGGEGGGGRGAGEGLGRPDGGLVVAGLLGAVAEGGVYADVLVDWLIGWLACNGCLGEVVGWAGGLAYG
jgi:hypothetical protein